MSMMNAGITGGWPSPIMQEMLGPNSPIPMTVEQGSWFASIVSLALILGPIPCGIMADRWGRRPVLQIVGPLSLATWTAVLYVTTFPELIMVRFAQGLLAACAYTVLPVYASEIAGPEIRGALGTMYQIMMNAGILYVFAAGVYLDYARLTYAMMAGPLLSCVLMATLLPESPHFYVMANKLPQAKRTMVWLRGDDTDSSLDDDMNAVVECITNEMRGASYADLFTDWVAVKMLIVGLCLSVFRIGAGVAAICTYASITFAETHMHVPANQLSLVFACSLLLSTLPATVLSDRVGRRPLMITSSALCFALNAIICAYFYADRHTGYDVTTYGWLCVTATGVLCFTFNLGYGTLYSTIICELFPANTRSASNAINTIVLTTACFLSVKVFPVIAEDGGMYRNFFVFAAFSLSSTAFCWLWLPETKGKTHAAIQRQLRGTDRVV
ncbi:facilitated trehalose transporter Tret1-like isoform X2 [Sipha flava]|nr:facilitated trehalose transporter Tret1-like isoform X2 [Sipha flava]